MKEKKQESEIMSLEEIQNCEIHSDTIKETIKQSEKRLLDVLDTRKTHDQKAFILFNGYITISIALFSIGAAFYKHHYMFKPFFSTCFIFVLGALCFMISLIDSKYGALGSNPKMWLRKGVLDGDDDSYKISLAYLAYYYQNRIKQSISSNNKKANWVRGGIIIGFIATVILGLLLYLSPNHLVKNSKKQNINITLKTNYKD
jgi:hypothetical protein